MNIIEEINRQIREHKKVVIAIDGPSAAGKTTYGKFLSREFDGLLIHTDNYFLPKARKTKERLSESGGNLDYERLEKEIMDNLNSEELISNHYNCKTEKLEAGEFVKNKQVIIVEGAYSMHRVLRCHYTLSLFITINEQLQVERILSRNGDKLLKRWIEEWIPLENYYFEMENLENHADYVIDTLMLAE